MKIKIGAAEFHNRAASYFLMIVLIMEKKSLTFSACHFN